MHNWLNLGEIFFNGSRLEISKQWMGTVWDSPNIGLSSEIRVIVISKGKLFLFLLFT